MMTLQNEPSIRFVTRVWKRERDSFFTLSLIKSQLQSVRFFEIKAGVASDLQQSKRQEPKKV